MGDARVVLARRSNHDRRPRCGRIEEGFLADIAAFDPERVGLGDTDTRYDLPAGAGRLYADAIGIAQLTFDF